MLFNIAADIVVNGMIAAEESLALPAGAIRNEKLEHHSVEEIYELLSKRRIHPKLPLADLLSGVPPASDELLGLQDRQELEAYWKQAIQQAQVLARSQNKGDLPSGLKRYLDEIADPQLDWRSQLWRYLVHTPNDYSGFDRRFIHQGLYLDALNGDSVEMFCCIDTSGSVGREELNALLAELHGILSAYPMLRCLLWYADASCYGPYELNSDRSHDIPTPEGGGGTDFRPFFKRVAKTWTREKEAVCVYLTDGYGHFPQREPELPVLWVVVPGGLEDAEFPWGDVVRLLPG